MRLMRTGCCGSGVMQDPILISDSSQRRLTYVEQLIGISYGSTLGATAAAMFPERMDKIILDGVLNPVEYYHS